MNVWGRLLCFTVYCAWNYNKAVLHFISSLRDKIRPFTQQKMTPEFIVTVNSHHASVQTSPESSRADAATWSAALLAGKDVAVHSLSPLASGAAFVSTVFQVVMKDLLVMAKARRWEGVRTRAGVRG